MIIWRAISVHWIHQAITSIYTSVERKIRKLYTFRYNVPDAFIQVHVKLQCATCLYMGILTPLRLKVGQTSRVWTEPHETVERYVPDLRDKEGVRSEQYTI